MVLKSEKIEGLELSAVKRRQLLRGSGFTGELERLVPGGDPLFAHCVDGEDIGKFHCRIGAISNYVMHSRNLPRGSFTTRRIEHNGVKGVAIWRRAVEVKEAAE